MKNELVVSGIVGYVLLLLVVLVLLVVLLMLRVVGEFSEVWATMLL